ncbi:hypothetical protein DH2020_039853 [Rehmannia glutinosa]|uniref:AB hydrolase-1 domain-containing protein n=1 Tax=Rehmannia glutinosa TaxID=99300 RepID=A0ABR0UVC5_REHGL
MAAGQSRKISAASARAHTRKPKSMSPSKFSGIFKKILFVCFVGLLAWAYQATQPPQPKTCGSTDGPPVTASRIQLKDGRYLAYQEYGVPKDKAKHKIVFIHGFDCCRHDVSAITAYLSPDIVESQGVYIVSFDRPGYGESDPHPTQTVKSLAFDIEELADQLGLGSKFYVVGFSIGGQIVWRCLKYIPHRLAGAALIAPVVNYWWPGIPSNMSEEAYKQHLVQDQWAIRVAHYLPWLNYWWNTQKLFPGLSLIAHSPKVLSRQDMELIPRIFSIREAYQAQVRQQGEFESLHRDLAISFGTWEFDPTDLKNPFSENEGSVHLWQGDEDLLVPVKIQRHIARQLPWIHYHEVPGAGHMFPFADGIADSIILALLAGKKGVS